MNATTLPVIDRGTAARLRVLYVVNQPATTSIPLELAMHFDLDEVDVRIVSFYGSSQYPAADQRRSITSLHARFPGDLRAVLRLHRIIREFRPDVIHVHHTISAFWTSLLGRLHGVAVAVKTEHNDRRFLGSGNRLLTRLTLPLLDHVIGNSGATLDSFSPWERRLCSGMTPIHNGVDTALVRSCAPTDAAALRRALGIGADTFVLGFVGRLIPQKNVPALIDAFAAALAQHPGMHLLMIGDGQQRAQLEAQVARLGIGAGVTLLGSVPRTEVYRHLGIMDAVIVPSRWEGFCNVAVESLAAGRPLICSDLPVLREVLADVPRFVDPSSTADITRAILDVAAMTPAARQQLGAHGAAFAERYAIDTVARRYAQLYQRLAAQGDTRNAAAAS